MATPPLAPVVGISPPDDFLPVEHVLGGPWELAVGLAWSPDGSLLAAGCGEGVCLWSMPDKDFSLFGRQPEQSVRGLAFSPDGQRLATVAWNPREDGGNQDIRVWNLLTGELETALSDSGCGYSHSEGGGGGGFDVEFFPDGQTLATLSGQGVRLWDVSTGQLIRTLEIPEQTRVDVRDAVYEEFGEDYELEVLPLLQLYGVAVSPKEPMVAGLSPWLGMWLWNGDTGEVVFSDPRSSVFWGNLSPADAVFTHDGSMVIAADGSLLDVSSWTMKRVFTMPTYVSGADFVEESNRHLASLSPDGSMVIVGGTGSILLSDFHRNWSLLFAGGNAHTAMAFSPDGLTLAALTYGGVPLWDLSGYPPNASPARVTLVDSLGLPMPDVTLFIDRSVAGEDFFHWSTRTDAEGRAALAVTREGYYHFLPAGDSIPRNPRGTPRWLDVPLRAAPDLTLKLIVPPRRHLHKERWPLEISGIRSGSTRVRVQIPEGWGPRSVYLARSTAGRHTYYVWQTRADSSGQAEFAIHTFGRASGFYRLWCRGQLWHSVPLNQGHSQRIELHEDGTFRMARGFPAKAVALPSSLTTALDPASPNPFNSETRLTYRLARSGHVDLRVYNSLGQPVRALESGVRHAGLYESLWDGRDDRGIPLAAGTYLLRLVHPDGVFTRRLLYLK